jgi:hypothetical protein
LANQLARDLSAHREPVDQSSFRLRCRFSQANIPFAIGCGFPPPLAGVPLQTPQVLIHGVYQLHAIVRGSISLSSNPVDGTIFCVRIVG